METHDHLRPEATSLPHQLKKQNKKKTTLELIYKNCFIQELEMSAGSVTIFTKPVRQRFAFTVCRIAKVPFEIEPLNLGHNRRDMHTKCCFNNVRLLFFSSNRL